MVEDSDGLELNPPLAWKDILDKLARLQLVALYCKRQESAGSSLRTSNAGHSTFFNIPYDQGSFSFSYSPNLIEDNLIEDHQLFILLHRPSSSTSLHLPLSEQDETQPSMGNLHFPATGVCSIKSRDE